jgi:hypothetical protein
MKESDKYTSKGAELFKAKGYKQVIDNISNDDAIEDKEIRESLKESFFRYLGNYDDSDIISYFCTNFFYTGDKQFKGTVIEDFDYKKRYGHVMKEKALKENWYKSYMKSVSKDASISEQSFNKNLDKVLVESGDRNTGKDKKDLLKTFINGMKIGHIKIRDYILWIFEGLDKEDIYAGYDMRNLPCLLALPGYDTKEWVTFSLIVPEEEKVYRATAFDANIDTAWRPGGKTRRHDIDDQKRSDKHIDGFKEFVLAPVNIQCIKSNIYKLG